MKKVNVMVLLLVGALWSCGGGEPTNNDITNDNTNNSEVTVTSEEDVVPEDVSQELNEVDLTSEEIKDEVEVLDGEVDAILNDLDK